jgi:hypothetical protein
MPETNNNAYIIAAYALTWLVLISYTIRLARRAAQEFARSQAEQGREA